MGFGGGSPTPPAPIAVPPAAAPATMANPEVANVLGYKKAQAAAAAGSGASGTVGAAGAEGLSAPPQTANLTLLGGTK